MTPAERLRGAVEAMTATLDSRLRRIEERLAFRDAHTIRPGDEGRYERVQEARRSWEQRGSD